MIENKITHMHIHVDGRMDVSILIGDEIWVGCLEKDPLETQCYWKDKEEKTLQESRDIRKIIRYQVTMLDNEHDEDKQMAIISSIRSLLRTTREIDAPRLSGPSNKVIETLTVWLDGFGDDV
tara:strand:- start:495 stop:860 length:366 start_codon:yes stop_codon:yes gene_type:complete